METVISRGEVQVEQFPIFLKGNVIKGFGRGSKKLGIPTANLDIEPYMELLSKIPTGVYYGWANVAGGPVYKMAMSIGWNPYFKNTLKTIEIHVMHQFKDDFYEEEIKVIALGYERPELDFKSLDDLITAIKDDISFANDHLELPNHKKFQTHSFFSKA